MLFYFFTCHTKGRRREWLFIKRIVCENKDGDKIFSFEFSGDISIQNYDNCEIADVESDDDVTVIRIQQIDD